VADRSARDPQVRVLHRSQGPAGRAYIRLSQRLWRRAGSASCRWNADFSHNRPMCRAVAGIGEGADMAVGRATCAGRHQMGTGGPAHQPRRVYARMAWVLGFTI